MHIKKFTLALLMGCFTLAACNEHVVEVDKRIETTLARTEEYLEASQIPDLPEPVDTVRMQNDIWLGTQSTKIAEGDPLPSWVEKEDGITVAISDQTTLPNILQEISDMTGITIRLDDLKAENAVPENTVPVKYSGALSGLLNYLSNRFNVYWRYKDGIITFFTQETRVFTIYALPTDTTLSASMTGATMGDNGGGGNANSNLSVSTDLKVWEGIEEGVKQVVGDKGKLSFSKVAGTITVTASPYIIRKVAGYVANWNEKLSRQVAITVRIYQVTLTNSDNYGLDIAAAFNSSLMNATLGGAASIAEGGTSGTGSLAMTLLKPKKFKNSKAIIQALSTQGKTALLTSSSVTTLNNKVAPVQISTSKNYLKEITVSSSGSGEDRTTDTDYSVDTLNYGFTMEILPRILDQGRLIVLFNLSITDLVDMTEQKIVSSTTGDSDSGNTGTKTETGTNSGSSSEAETETTKLQLPTMKMRGFVQEIAMRSGQTLVLSGFEDLSESTNTSGIGRAKMGLLGGTAINETNRNVLVITMTPEVLQSPLSPEALMRNI